jgi:hypothetical protein
MRTNFFLGKMRLGRPNTLAFGLAIILALLLLFGLQSANPAHAATTFTVNFTGDENDTDFPNGSFNGSSDGKCDLDSGTAGDQCTLRAAIQQANVSSGADTIAFNIPGGGVRTISPGFELPTITHTVTIDGYTQPGANPATSSSPAALTIELSGPSVSPGQFVDGLELSGASASNSVIRGLVINGFSADGIRCSSSASCKVEGNFIGTDASGTVDEGNHTGVSIGGNSTIGGTSPDKRNLISGNDFSGVSLTGRGNKVEGNLIGTNINGTKTPNRLGNTSTGVNASSFSNNNIIGDADPSDGSTNAANVIAFNWGRGVTVGFGAGNGNSILSNSIYDNGLLGIDFLRQFGDLTNGVTPNDPTDPDTGPNRLQNYPEITSAQFFGGSTSINGTLNSTPSTRKKKSTFILQFFSSPEDPPDSGKNDPSGFGEGKTFLGQIQVKTDRQGNASPSPFTLSVNEDLSNQVITAAATNKRTGDTSEFSEAEPVQGLVIGP